MLMTAWDDATASPPSTASMSATVAPILIERGGARDHQLALPGAAAPVLRYDMDRDGRVMSMLARTPGETRWRLVRRINRDDTRDFQVVGATPPAGRGAGRGPRRRTRTPPSVRTLDTRTMALGEWSRRAPSRDVADVLTSGRRITSSPPATTRTGRSYDFADASMARHFRARTGRSRRRCNIELFDIDERQTRWLARVSGPREPGTYVFYDTRPRAKSLGRLAVLG